MKYSEATKNQLKVKVENILDDPMINWGVYQAQSHLEKGKEVQIIHFDRGGRLNEVGFLVKRTTDLIRWVQMIANNDYITDIEITELPKPTQIEGAAEAIWRLLEGEKRKQRCQNGIAAGMVKIEQLRKVGDDIQFTSNGRTFNITISEE